MPNDQPTWADIKNHLHYGKWVYLAIALVCWFAFDLVYQMTEYRAPAERKVDIELVQGGFLDLEKLDALKAGALAAGQAYDDTLEEVNFAHIQYTGDPETDIYGVQKYSVMIGAREGDIWIVPRAQFEQLHWQGGLAPLDGYIEQGLLRVDGVDLAPLTLNAQLGKTDEKGELLPPDGPESVFGLPAAMLPGLAEAGYAVEDACACIMAYSNNPDTAAVVLGSLIAQLADGTLPQEEKS